MNNRIEKYVAVSESRASTKKEKVSRVHQEYSIELEMFEKSIKADIHYLTESLRRGENGWPWVLEALERKIEGHSELVDDFLEQQYLK